MRMTSLALFVCLLASAGCNAPVEATPAPGPAPAAPPQATPVTLKLLTFAEVEKLLAGHKGRVVVLDVWSSSCVPCVKEFPQLVALSRRYPAADVACVSLNIDFYGGKNSRPEDFQADVLQRLTHWQATFDNVLCRDEDTTVLRRLELTAPPGVYVYNRAGQLAHKFTNDNASTEAEYFTYTQVGDLVEQLVHAP